MAEILGQQEVKKAAPVAKQETKADVSQKLEDGWEYVDIPAEDLYNYKFDGIAINLDNYGPGRHLVHPDIAATLNDRKKVWEEANRRLMRPQADRKSLTQLGNNV